MLPPDLTAVPVPAPRSIRTPLRGRPPRRNGKVRSTHPVPVPSPPGAGWINKPSGPRPPVRLIPFPSFLAPPLPRLSPLLSSSSCSARSRPAARAPAVAVKDSPRPEGRVGCTDLGAACPRWWGEAAPASRNVSSRYTRGGAVVGQLVVAVSFAYALSIVVVISKEAIVSWILYALLSGIGDHRCHFVA